MKTKFIFAIGAVLPILMGSCSDSFNAGEAAGEGRVILRPSVSTDITASRALTADDEQSLSESCLIWISSQKGLVRKYDGISSVPTSGIKLVGGQYTAEAWAGDSVPASWDQRYYKGVEPFTVTAGGTTQVDLKCTVANTAVSVKYADAIDEVLTDYTLTVGHSCGKLTWEGRDERRGYFMMNSRDKDLTYTLTGTRQDGSEYTLDGKIEAVKPATEYVLNIKYEGVDVETGGAYFSIEIDETTVDITDEIVIISAPNIVALYDQSLDSPIYGEAHKFTRQGFFIAAATKMSSVYVKVPSMENEIGLGEFDLIGCSDEIMAQLNERGVKMIRTYNEEQDVDNVKLTFEPELLNLLTDGTYEIEVEAAIELTNEDGLAVRKANKAKMTIVVSDADVEVTPLASNSPAIWASEVTLTGKVLKDGVESVGFNYREEGASEWTYVDGVVSRAALAKGDIYTVKLTGLNPGTTYEYVPVAGNFVGATIFKFTTESAAQLPNAGFENWQDSAAPFLIYGAGEEMFWDSGNHGSKTMGKNVTVPETDIKHGGNRSIKLASQFVGVGALGKFAAGNMFIGEYLKTDGTDGVLGWGRPFTSRPKALKGYVKYNPVTIDNVKDLSQAPSETQTEFAKGNMDKGVIYIALLDNSKAQGNTEYPDYPVVVKTKKPKQLFNKDGADVIAYGEIVFSEATSGDGMIEFTIPLVYNRVDVRPSYILCTASASKAGDYFTGGNGSNMYIDDLELVY